MLLGKWFNPLQRTLGKQTNRIEKYIGKHFERLKPKPRRRTGQLKVEYNTLLRLLTQVWDNASMGTDIKNINGFIYDPEVSTSVCGVFVKDEIIVIACRGTIPSNKEDIFVDLEIVRMRYRRTKRYNDLNEQQAKILEKYPDMEQYVYTGHSLGGLESFVLWENVKRNMNTFWVGFNPAPIHNFYSYPASERIQLFRTNKDIVSGITPYGKNVEVINCTDGLQQCHEASQFKDRL